MRRFYAALSDLLVGKGTEETVYKIELLMKQAKISTEDRKVVNAAMELENAYQSPTAAMELEDGSIITGKTSDLLGASASLLLNALKHLAGIDRKVHMIAPSAIEPIQRLKVSYLGSKNPRLHTDEVLIALSVSATINPIAQLALEQLPKLAGCEVHTSVMLSDVDKKVFKKLGVNLTSEPKYETKNLFH